MYKTLKVALLQIEQNLNWGNISEWKERHYIKLQEKIFDASNISVNHQTLKRVFIKVIQGENYMPQDATLNAIAIYLGYKSWIDFDSQVNRNLNNTSLKEKVKSNPRIEKNNRIVITNLLVSLLIGSLLIGILSFFSAKLYYKYYIPDIHFTATPDIIKNRASVMFSFDLSRLKGDSIFFDDGRGCLTYLDQKTKKATSLYVDPGYYTTKIICDKKVIATYPVLVESNDWFVKVLNIDKHSLEPFNISPFRNGVLAIYPDEAYSLADSFTNVQCQFSIVNDFKLNGDSAMMEFKIKAYPNKDSIYCHYIKIILTYEYAVERISFTSASCFALGGLKIGNTDVNQTDNDVQKFSQDVLDWSVVKTIKKNNTYQLFFNNTLIASLNYDGRLGNLRNMKILVSSGGEIDYYRLSDGINIYADDFND